MQNDELIRTLRQLHEMLRGHGVQFWPDKLAHLAQRVEAFGAQEASDQMKTELTELFGGMGTLTDLHICRQNGHVVHDEREANRQLRALRQKLWDAVHDRST